mgnify:CR=1 FL=1
MTLKPGAGAALTIAMSRYAAQPTATNHWIKTGSHVMVVGADGKVEAQGTHEGCIEQVHGLFAESLYGSAPHIDEEGRLRFHNPSGTTPETQCDARMSLAELRPS